MGDSRLSRLTRCYRFGGEASSEELRQSIRSSFPRLLVQAVDEGAVPSERLVQMIGEQTLEAERVGAPLAKKPEVDLLLRLGGTTQISRAIQEVGVRPGGGFVLIVIGDRANLLELEAGEGRGWKRLSKKRLGRNDLQRIERAALLAAERP